MGSTPSLGEPKRLRLRYAATCSMCGRDLPPGTEAYWDRSTHSAACIGCLGESVQAAGLAHAGGSALAHAEELKDSAVRRADRQWGPTAAAVAAKVVAEDRDVKAWSKGGDGESRLGGFLEREIGDVAIVLHDRLIPGTNRANIDHLVVAPTGVWVIDAKTYSGEVRRVEAGTIFRSDPQLYIGRRNQTKLVGGLSRQVTAVRAALDTRPDLPRADIYPVLCTSPFAA